MNTVHELINRKDHQMFPSHSLDKTLTQIINGASVATGCCMVLFTLYTFVDMPDATNGYWGFGALSHQLVSHYSEVRI